MKYNTYMLGDVCTFIDYRGKTPPKTSSGIPLITAKIIKNNVIQEPKEFIDESFYDEWMRRGIPKKGDVVFTTEAPLGEVARITSDSKMAFAQRVIILEPNEDILDAGYLFYALQDRLLKNRILARSSGTTVFGIKSKELKKVEIDLPCLEIQRKISNVLLAIDEKISINNLINDNLQEQIEILLLAFLDGKDTMPVKLGDYLYIKGRIGWKGLKKSEYLSQSGYRIINGETLTKSGIDWNKAGYISEERYTESPEIMLQVGDILLSKDGTIGKIGYVDSLELPTSVASGIFVIRNNKPDIISTTFIYYLLKSRLFESFITARTEGSVIPHLYQKDFMEFEFPLPTSDNMAKFEELTEPMFFRIVNNLNENKKLATLRDTLLPKLMSGELDVSDLDI